MKKYKKIVPLLILAVLSSCSQKNLKSFEKKSTPPEWSYNSTIYEANIRQYTPEGTFAAFEKHLPKIKEMGIEIIWLMPIHPIGEKNRKGTLGSYYSVKDYKGINPNFGTKEDFKRLVDKIHELDMFIIIDWVANHTAWDHHWTVTNKNFYTLDSLGNFVPPVPDWSDVIDLNYENIDLHLAMIDALKYWVKEFDIDGYRCDVAAMVPNDFWNKARKELDKIKPVFMLAEAHEPELHKNGFDMTYNWQLKDLMNDYAKEKVSIEDIKKHFNVDEKEYPANAFRMTFTTNHDENSWNGTVFERLGRLAEPFTVLISTASGMPLVYSGQEAGMDKALEFFEKDEIEWKDHKKREIFTKIFKVKKSNKALWNGEKGGEMNFINVSDNKNVLSFYREKENDKIVVVLNLSDKNAEISFSDKKIFGGYNNLFTEKKVVLDGENKFILAGYNYLVFENN
jgi:glycosidase